MKKIFNNKYFKWISSILLFLVSITILVVSTIFFCKYDFDSILADKYWLKYFLLCLMIISSSIIITSCLIFLNYLYKNSKTKNDKIISEENNEHR